jgi:hypothetical protein
MVYDQVRYTTNFELTLLNHFLDLICRSQIAGREDSPLVVDQTGPPESNHASFYHALPQDEPRVGVYDLKFSITTSDGAQTEKNKILVISWVPAGIKPGMSGMASLLALSFFI